MKQGHPQAQVNSIPTLLSHTPKLSNLEVDTRPRSLLYRYATCNETMLLSSVFVLMCMAYSVEGVFAAAGVGAAAGTFSYVGFPDEFDNIYDGVANIATFIYESIPVIGGKVDHPQPSASPLARYHTSSI